MDGHGDRRPPWRRLREWLDLGREDIQQEGLLAGRTLLVTQPRTSRDERDRRVAGGRSGPDEAAR